MEKTVRKKQKDSEKALSLAKEKFEMLVMMGWDSFYKEYINSPKPIFSQFVEGAEAFRDYLLKAPDGSPQ